jgi:uncharacterized protein YdhG (YjbR/CyaY superfamily)
MGSIARATRTTKKPAAKTAPTVDEYLAAAPTDKRAALLKVRRAIKAAAPKATEGMSYGLVGYKHNGKPLVYIGYAKTHCALYGSTGQFVKEHASELKAYDLSKGTIRFPADKPLPDRLVMKMVRARVAEIDAG